MEDFMKWLNEDIEDLKTNSPSEQSYVAGKYSEAIKIRQKICEIGLSAEITAMEHAKEAVLELQDMYDYAWNKARFDECKALISVFSILNKHIFRETGWRIRFDGSKADELLNVLGGE